MIDFFRGGLLASVLACSAGLSATMAAEPDRTATVEATGTATLRRPPDLLRLRIELTAKDTTMRGALEKLKDRGEAARLQLAKLGAIKESIHLGDPGISAASGQQAQMEMMIQQRLGRAHKSKTKPAPPSVRVSAVLTARWPLASQSAADALVTAGELREKITAADLSGSKESQKLSAEEEELAEETETMAAQAFGNYQQQQQQQPGAPAFSYVLKLTPEEQAKLLADAFADARSKATLLATAANKRLGPLEKISSPSLTQPENDMMSRWQAQAYGMPYTGTTDATAEHDEVVRDQPGTVTHAISVTASFTLD